MNLKLSKKTSLLASLVLLLSVVVVSPGKAEPTSAMTYGSNTANDQKVSVNGTATRALGGGCAKGVDENGYCKGNLECNTLGETVFSIDFWGGRKGDVYWSKGNPNCIGKTINGVLIGGPKPVKIHRDISKLAQCLKYIKVYRFYGDTNNPTKAITESEITPTQQCQNVPQTNFNLRLFNPNPWDYSSSVPVGTPWNYKNKTFTDNYNLEAEPFITYASEDCIAGLSSSTRYNGCRLLSGPAKKITASSCLDVKANSASSLEAKLSDNTKINFEGRETTVGLATKSVIFSIVQSLLSVNTSAKFNDKTVNSLAWLPYQNQIPTSPQSINQIESEYNCSSAIQYIPVEMSNSANSVSRVVGTCIVGVGDVVHLFQQGNGDYSFAHYGEAVFSSNGVNGVFHPDRYIKTRMNITGKEMITSPNSKKLISSYTTSYNSKYKEALRESIENSEILGEYPVAKLEQYKDVNLSIARSLASGSTSGEGKFQSFSGLVSCYSQVLNPALLNAITTPTLCPDGSVMPADGVCKRCPDGSIMTSDGVCPDNTEPTANCDSPCIEITLNTPSQFAVGGSLRPQSVKAVAKYNLSNNCGHDACVATSDIEVNLQVSSSGRFTKCSTTSQENGCSYFVEVFDKSPYKSNLRFKFYSATNPGEVIKIKATGVGEYKYMDLIPQPDHQECVGFGSERYCVMVPTPPIERWSTPQKLTTSSQNKSKGVPVIGSKSGR